MFLRCVICFFILFASFKAHTLQVVSAKYDSTFAKVEEFIRTQKLSKESALCLQSLPQKTRYFLYQRYVEELKESAYNSSSERLIQNYGKMSYLVCRESGGLGVALSAHGSEARVSYYGHLYSSLKKGIQEMIAKRFKYKRKNYFSITTNVGLFQVSLDQVDDLPDKYDPELEVHDFFLDQIKVLSGMRDRPLLLACGTQQIFDLQKEPELLRELRESLNLMRYQSELERLSLYAKLQTLCPALNFELAKKIYNLKGARYFGPLSNKRNSRSCGTSFSLCAPIFKKIYDLVF